MFFCSYPLFAFANLFSYFFPQNTKQKFPLDMTYSSYTLPLLFPSLFPSTRGWHNESNTRFCLHAYKSFSINAISGLELRLTKRFGFKLPFSQHHSQRVNARYNSSKWVLCPRTWTCVQALKIWKLSKGTKLSKSNGSPKITEWIVW